MNSRSRFLFVVLLLLLAACPTSATGRGELTILLVTSEKERERTLELIERLRDLRDSSGLSDKEMPVRVFFIDHDLDWAKRVGTITKLPVLGVALWNEPQSLGPRRFLGDAFAREAEVDDCPRVVQSFLRIAGKPALPPFASADTLPIPQQQGLLVESSRFEASGTPNVITHFAVRLKNDSLETLRNVEVRFLLRRINEREWRECGNRRVDKIPSFQSRSVEYVGNTRELFLLDLEGNAVPCHYRVEIKDEQGRVRSHEGRFEPSNRPID